MKKLLTASILAASMATSVAFAGMNDGMGKQNNGMSNNNGSNNAAVQLLSFITQFQGNNGFGGLSAQKVEIILNPQGGLDHAMILLSGPVSEADKKKIYAGLEDARDFIGNNGINGANVSGGADHPVLAIKDMTAGPNAATYAIAVSYNGRNISFKPQ